MDSVALPAIPDQTFKFLPEEIAEFQSITRRVKKINLTNEEAADQLLRMIDLIELVVGSKRSIEIPHNRGDNA